MIDVELAIRAKQAPVYVVLNSPFLPRDTHKSSAWSAASFAGQSTAASRQEDSCCLIDARSLARNPLVDPNYGWRNGAVFLVNRPAVGECQAGPAPYFLQTEVANAPGTGSGLTTPVWSGGGPQATEYNATVVVDGTRARTFLLLHLAARLQTTGHTAISSAGNETL
jgi:hypothetical protein